MAPKPEPDRRRRHGNAAGAPPLLCHDREMAAPSEKGRTPSPTLRQVVTTVIVAAALAGFVWAFTLGDTSPTVRTSVSAVERFLPAENSSLELRQTQVGVDLAPGWIGALQIDDTPIPDDQLNCFAIESCAAKASGGVDPQNIFFFVPGEGKVIDELGPGPHCATAMLTPVEGTTTNTGPQSVKWCFKVA